MLDADMIQFHVNIVSYGGIVQLLCTCKKKFYILICHLLMLIYVVSYLCRLVRTICRLVRTICRNIRKTPSSCFYSVFNICPKMPSNLLSDKST